MVNGEVESFVCSRFRENLVRCCEPALAGGWTFPARTKFFQIRLHHGGGTCMLF